MGWEIQYVLGFKSFHRRSHISFSNSYNFYIYTAPFSTNYFGNEVVCADSSLLDCDTVHVVPDVSPPTSSTSVQYILSTPGSHTRCSTAHTHIHTTTDHLQTNDNTHISQQAGIFCNSQILGLA